ncbi:MAG: type II toxin-antitoxin system HicB family antitoxin [Anaerolineae bacterium]|nr:type II toxin-antitoxin system HicB family antitoxin [Anaerolineae bacterium]
MVYDVILSRRNNKYVARIKEWPDVVVEEGTREEALSQVREKLVDYLTHQVEVVQIEVQPPANVDNPWLKNFGRFQDDPTYDDFLAEVEAYRRQIDKNELRSS